MVRLNDGFRWNTDGSRCGTRDQICCSSRVTTFLGHGKGHENGSERPDDGAGGLGRGVKPNSTRSRSSFKNSSSAARSRFPASWSFSAMASTQAPARIFRRVSSFRAFVDSTDRSRASLLRICAFFCSRAAIRSSGVCFGMALSVAQVKKPETSRAQRQFLRVRKARRKPTYTLLRNMVRTARNIRKPRLAEW